MNKPLLVVFIGPSGSGKGTQARMLCDEFGFDYVEMGGILRDEVKSQSELGKKIDKIIHGKSQLVPDEITKDLVKNVLMDEQKGKSVVLDGYPRTLQQVEDLDEIMKEMSGDRELIVFEVDISDEEAMRRLTQRRVCKKCKNALPSDAKDKTCPKCGGELEHREDDEPEKIKERLQWAHEKVFPAIEEYRKRGMLEEVNGERSIEDVNEDVRGRLLKKIKN